LTLTTPHPQKLHDREPSQVSLLAEITQRQQVAVLISAHEMNPLLPVMDRVVYLAGGRAASGTTDEVIREDVLSALYGHHVDVLHMHGRVLMVAHAGDRSRTGCAHCTRRGAPLRLGREPAGALRTILATPAQSSANLARDQGLHAVPAERTAGHPKLFRRGALAGPKPERNIGRESARG
jgi:hypothetical protein